MSEGNPENEEMYHQPRPTRLGAARRAAALLLLLVLPSMAAATDELVFVGVTIDGTTKQADDKLLDYLRRSEGLRFRAEAERSYEEVIDVLRGVTGDGHFLEPEMRQRFVARATPYVLVAAQMLGAQVEVLATYTNRQGDTTYRSSFVVNRERFEEQYGAATQASLLAYLRQADTPIRFVYHDRFSTSSFFLPSLFFRSHSIFSTDVTVGDDQTAIRSERLPEAVLAEAENREKRPGSTDLVKAVARGDYDLAAVWDGSRKKFEQGGAYEELGKKVLFIELDADLPNDLLVAPANLDSEALVLIKRAIDRMGEEEIGVGDFAKWTGIKDGPGRIACAALSTLRMDAEAQISSPAVVRIETETGTESLIGAVENAVRRMGHDYKLYDEAFHLKHDLLWTLSKLHDDQAVTAIELISKIEHSGLEPQRIPISFDSHRNLTDRIEEVARKRLHRIGYVWPYLEETPTVIHDFDLIPDGTVRVLPIRRGDLRHNDYELLGGDEQEISFEPEDDFRLLLSREEFESEVRADLDFDPLSNVVYRVVLPRQEVDRTFFRALTAGLVGLFVLAALGLLWDLKAGLGAQPAAERPRLPAWLLPQAKAPRGGNPSKARASRRASPAEGGASRQATPA